MSDFKGRHFEGEIVLWALRKGQAAAFNLTHDIRGEARIAERAFGLGSPVLAEVIQLVAKGLELNAARMAYSLKQALGHVPTHGLQLSQGAGSWLIFSQSWPHTKTSSSSMPILPKPPKAHNQKSGNAPAPNFNNERDIPAYFFADHYGA